MYRAPRTSRLLGAAEKEVGDCPNFRATKTGLSPSEIGKLFLGRSLVVAAIACSMMAAQGQQPLEASRESPGRVTISQSDDRLRVLIGGELFAEYIEGKNWSIGLHRRHVGT